MTIEDKKCMENEELAVGDTVQNDSEIPAEDLDNVAGGAYLNQLPQKKPGDPTFV